MKKIVTKLVVLCVLFTLLGTVAFVHPAYGAEKAKTLKATARAEDIQKHGNVVLSLTCEEIKNAGYEYGDTVKVKFLGKTVKVPFVSSYSDVESGKPAILMPMPL